jgi:glycosyltransferase involved in cell wall biosynthesis
MKILYNHQVFTQTYGGISRYFVELANNIALYKNKKVTVKINSPFFKTNYLSNINQKILFNGFKVSDFKGSERLCSIVNSILSPILFKHYDPDIIHDSYYNSISLDKSRAKKIITVHDMIHELLPSYFSKEDKTSQLKKFAVTKADHIICVSKNTQKNLVDIFNIDIKKTSVIYHGFSLTSSKINEPKGFRKPYLLYVGNRNGYKNFTRFVKAYASPKIKNFYDLVTFGGGKLNDQELLLFDKLKIPRDSLQQINGNDAVLAGYYKNASLFVYPSLYEGFGIPPLEAMNYGCPVACSNTGSIPEIVGRAAILFDPYSVESIRDKIIYVLYNNKIRSSLTIKGFQQIKNFSWKKCAKETYKVYKNVLNSKH